MNNIIYTYIYTLSDNDYNIRYVGKTDNPDTRLRRHISSSKNNKNYKDKWIVGLIKNNEKPIFEIIDIVLKSNWIFWEKYWISQIKAWNFSLVNGTSGGEGGDGFKNKKHTEKTKKILSEKYKHPGYIPKGEKNGNHKLKLHQVLEIKEKVKNGIDKILIANEYKINKNYIYLLISGKRWKELPRN